MAGELAPFGPPESAGSVSSSTEAGVVGGEGGSPYRALLVVLIALSVLNGYGWLTCKDYVFHRFDDLHHLAQAWRWQQALLPAADLLPRERASAWAGLGTSPHPPLIPLVAGLVAGCLGRPTAEVATLSLLLYIPALAWGTWGLARRCGLSEGASLASVWLTLSASRILYFSRVFYLDVPLTAWVVMGLSLLLATERLRRPGPVVGFGVVAGLGFLTKWTFGLFLVGPFAWVLRGALGRGGWRRGWMWRNLMLAGGICSALAGPWYLSHWGPMVRYARELGFTPGGSSWSVWGPISLIWSVVTELCLPALGLAGLAGMIWSLGNPARGRLFAPVLLALLVPVGFFSMQPVQDPRFLLPGIPLVAVLALAWSWGPRGGWVVGPLILAGLWSSLGWLEVAPSGQPAPPNGLRRVILGAPELPPFRSLEPRGVLWGSPRPLESMVCALRSRIAAGERLVIGLSGPEVHPVPVALRALVGDHGWGFSAGRSGRASEVTLFLQQEGAPTGPPRGWVIRGRWQVDFAEEFRSPQVFVLWESPEVSGSGRR